MKTRWRLDRDGYFVGRMAGHPVASRTGHVRRARAVLYDKIGMGEHRCSICGTALRWWRPAPDLVEVEHLDGDRQNDNPANLVPVCHRCNASRWRPRPFRMGPPPGHEPKPEPPPDPPLTLGLEP